MASHLTTFTTLYGCSILSGIEKNISDPDHIRDRKIIKEEYVALPKQKIDDDETSP
jgi:hypothetical protein